MALREARRGRPVRGTGQGPRGRRAAISGEGAGGAPARGVSGCRPRPSPQTRPRPQTRAQMRPSPQTHAHTAAGRALPGRGGARPGPARPGQDAPLLGPLPLLRLLLPALLLLPLLLQLLKLLPLELPFLDGGVAQVFGRIERNLPRENGAGWGGVGRPESLPEGGSPARPREAGSPRPTAGKGLPGRPPAECPRAPSLIALGTRLLPREGDHEPEGHPRTRATAPGHSSSREAPRPAPQPGGRASTAQAPEPPGTRHSARP